MKVKVCFSGILNLVSKYAVALSVSSSVIAAWPPIVVVCSHL